MRTKSKAFLECKMAKDEDLKRLELLAQGTFAQRLVYKVVMALIAMFTVLFIVGGGLGGYVAFKTFEYINNTETYIVEEYETEEYHAGNGTIINDTNINNSEVATNGDNEKD